MGKEFWEYLIYKIALLVLITCLMGCSTPESPSKAEEQRLDSLLRHGVQLSKDLEFDKAHDVLTKLSKRARNMGSNRYEVLAYVNLGGLYLRYNADDQALNYFLRSRDKAEEYGLSSLLNTVYNNLGVVYTENNSPEEAADFFSQALQISRAQGENERVAMNLINLGIAESSLDRDSIAIRYYHEALDILLTSGDSLHAGAALNNIGNIHYDNGNYQEASDRYRRAFELGQTAGDQFYESEYLLNIGKTSYQFSRYDSAISSIKRALEGFRKTRNTQYIITSYDWLSRSHRQLDNMSRAISYSDSSSAWRDTLLEEKAGKYMSELEMNYEFGKKQREIEMLQQRTERQRYIWIGVISTGLIFSLLIFYMLRTKNINLRQRNIILNKEQKLNKLEMEKNEAERLRLEKDLEAGKKMAELEKKRFRQELKFKDRELATKALHIVNKNETFSELKEILENIEVNGNPQNNDLLVKARQILRNNASLDRDWEAFKLHFQEVHPDFFDRLEKDFPSLSDSDLRLCAYLLIGLNSKEIAQIINISPASVRKRKQRLREKLGMNAEEEVKNLLERYKIA